MCALFIREIKVDLVLNENFINFFWGFIFVNQNLLNQFKINSQCKQQQTEFSLTTNQSHDDNKV